jgi:outer membrane protein assembly factor BamE (lipoprotein component of BamABCDE complex)
MKPLLLVLSAIVLTALLNGCQTPEEQEQQTNQRRYDAIIKKNQEMIDRNQKMLDQNQ